jgi:hypothetical protein
MAKFIDGEERDWNVTLNVGLIEDIQEKLGIDIDMLLKKPEALADTLFDTPKRFVQLMYLICEKEIEERKLSPRDFGILFDRETIDKAVNSFLEAVVTFYPRSAVGGVLKENLPTMLKEMDQKLVKEATMKVKEVLSNLRTN